jgi:hypothetical protein
MAQPEKKAEQPGHQMSEVGCLVRLGWMMFGNAALVICIGTIANHRGRFLSAADAVFWVVVLVLIWLRHVDITRMKGRTASGQPATLSHWKRYAGLLLAFSLVAWAVAHAVAWFRG